MASTLYKKIRAKRIKKSGFASGLTLIELMVANVIAVLAFTVLFYVAFTIQDNIGLTSGVLNISEKGRFAINSISKDVREAESLISSFTKNSTTYTTDDDTIILEIPAIDTNGDIILDADNDIAGYDKIIYELQSAALYRIIADKYSTSSRTVGSESITDDIDTLLFSSEGTDLSSVADMGSVNTITVKIKTATTVAGVGRENEVITSASLRNK